MVPSAQIQKNKEECLGNLKKKTSQLSKKYNIVVLLIFLLLLLLCVFVSFFLH